MLDREKAEKILFSLLKITDIDNLCFIRMGENAVFKDVKNNLIIRVYRENRNYEYVAREIEIVKKLACLEVNVPVLSDKYGGVIQHEGHFISVWKEILHNKESKIDYYNFGNLLKCVHDNMKGMQLLHPAPKWNPLKSTEIRFNRIKKHGLLSDDEQYLIAKLLKRLETEYEKVILNNSDMQLIHGDTHVGNLLVEESSNELFIIDFENNSIGSLYWDLIPTLISYERFGLSEDKYELFVRGYGFDVRESELYESLKFIREVSMTIWLIQKRGESLEVDSQIDIRLESLLRGEKELKWKGF